MTKIGDYKICNDQAPFFIAELGICHGGNVKTALELTEAAISAGAD